MDDVCASQHGQKGGADQNFQGKLRQNCQTHKFFEASSQGFCVHHYAGVVRYNVDGFCDRNKDVFYDDLIELMQSSTSDFIRKLFPENLQEKAKSRKRPVTAGAKIKSQVIQCVTIENRQSPFYVVNRVNLTGKNYIKYHASPLN